MTLFLTGDNFQRRITAKDANRLLKAAQEVEAGAGNLTTRDIQRAWNNNHILVKWSQTAKQYAGSVIGIGNPSQRYTYGAEPYSRYAQEMVVYPGQQLRIKKHWFRYGVLQTTAAQNEIVPVAISGNTMAFVNSANMQEGARVCVLDSRVLNFSNTLYNYFEKKTDFGSAFGHAVVIKGSGAAIPKSRALVRLNDRNTIWRALLTKRVTTTEFEGFLQLYGGVFDDSTNSLVPISDIKIYDPFGMMPNTSEMPIGSIGVTAGVEITQNLEVIAGEDLPDIVGYIVSVNRGTTLTNVQMKTT